MIRRIPKAINDTTISRRFLAEISCSSISLVLVTSSLLVHLKVERTCAPPVASELQSPTEYESVLF